MRAQHILKVKWIMQLSPRVVEARGILGLKLASLEDGFAFLYEGPRGGAHWSQLNGRSRLLWLLRHAYEFLLPPGESQDEGEQEAKLLIFHPPHSSPLPEREEIYCTTNDLSCDWWANSGVRAKNRLLRRSRSFRLPIARAWLA
jgi:hypothetical protein